MVKVCTRKKLKSKSPLRPHGLHKREKRKAILKQAALKGMITILEAVCTGGNIFYFNQFCSLKSTI